ncbi:MAG: hypothetical protein OXT03_03515 [Alphaproteobacteria bacterium]|nr:hypothetical protein [Alphaproteobacteria bacterium]
MGYAILLDRLDLKLRRGLILCLFFIILPVPAQSIVWLQRQNALEVSVSRRTSQATSYQQGQKIFYGRREIEIYSEYGLREDITISGKYIAGRSGIGKPIEQTPVQIADLNLRFPTPWAQTKFLPYGIEALWQNLNQNQKPRRELVSSMQAGLGFNGNRDDDINMQFLFGLADKVESSSTHPIYLYTEISSKVSLWPQGDQSVELTSRMEIGLGTWYIAYERVDGETRAYYNHHVHQWFWETAIPLARKNQLLVKWGYDRVHPTVPREEYLTIALRFRFN